MLVSDASLGQFVRLGPGMEDPLPGDFLRAHPFRGGRHAPGAEVGRIGQYPGQHGWDAAWRFLSTDVREPIGKPGPGMNLHQEIRHLDQRVHIGQFPLQLLGRGGHVAGQRSNDELSSVEPDAFELAVAGPIRERLRLKSRVCRASER